MREEERARFEALVASRTPALLRTAYLLTGDLHHAEDLLQVAFARTYTRWGRLRSADAAEAYLRRVLTTQAVSWRRRFWHGERPSTALPEVAADDLTVAVDRRDVLRRALAILPPAQRAVLVLRFYEDMTERATADLLGVSVGTVKSRASRALDALRKQGLILTPEEVS